MRYTFQHHPDPKRNRLRLLGYILLLSSSVAFFFFILLEDVVRGIISLLLSALILGIVYYGFNNR